MTGAVPQGAHAFLEKLLLRGDRRTDATRSVSLPVEQSAFRTAREADEFREVVEACAAAGGVVLKRGRGGFHHLIERVALADPGKLAAFLGTDRFPQRAAALADALAAHCRGSPWMEDLLQVCRRRWERGERAWGLGCEEGVATDRFRILAALRDGLAASCDARTFSTRLFLDREAGSKVLDRHRSGVAEMLRHALGLEGDDSRVMDALGLVRYPQSVLLSGPVHVRRPDGCYIPGTMSPHASYHPDWFGDLSWIEGVARPVVLTVENLTSFHRHVREIRQPAVCVVYTGGFPSQGVVDCLKRLVDTSPVRPRFLHWGDIDVGGLGILETLDRIFGDVGTHLMGEELLERLGRPAERELPSRFATGSPAVRTLALAVAETGRFLEQELVDPAPAGA
jgi:hypothetical protein